MVDYKYSELYKQESVDKQLNIAFDSGNIANEEIHSEQFELTESLCSDAQLRFGSCEASMIKFRISNIFTPLKDKWLTVTETLNHNTDTPFKFGEYKVYSDKPTADRSYRDVVAYDKMYDIINADVASWYNSLTFPMQLKSFRDSFFDYFGIDQEEVALVNDAMTIEKTIEPSVLSGKDVLQSICQINGCFGHIGRDGKFQYIFLKRSIDGGLFPDTELYPSDKLFPVKESIRNNLYPYNNLYPSDDLIPVKSISSDSTYPQIITTIPKSAYIHCYYEDYLVKKIDKLIIRQEENDVGCTVGNGDNAYIIEDNFLVYGKSQEELTEIATNTLAVIEDIEYRPITDSEVLGNPCLEVGDAIRFYTRYEIVDSYILNRTLKGIQGLIDSYVSDGEEYQSEKVNDIQTDIKQLKGKSNTLERTIEETRSTIANLEEGLQSEISQTADAIRLEVADNTGKISTIEQTVDGITQTVENNAGKISTIEQNVESITSTVASSQSKYDTTGYDITLFGYGTPDDNNYLPDEHNGEYYLDQETGKVYLSNGSHKWIHVNTLKLITEELSSQIEQAVGSIVLKVDANGNIVEVALTGDPEEGTTFTVDADNISLTATEVIDMLSNGEINLTGKNITITSDNFNVDSDGNMSCKNASVTGDVNATTLNAYNKLRLFIGTTFDKDYRDAIWVQSNEDESPNDVEWMVYSNIRRMMLPVVFKQGITVKGLSSLGEISASKIESLDYIYTQHYLRSYYASNAVTTASTNCYIDSEGTISKTSTTSSKRFKDDVTTELCEELNPRSLYDVDIVQFKYKKDYFTNKEDIRYRKDLIGFIAEDIYEKYPICADYHMEDENLVVDGWNQQYMIPAMLKLIQEQHKQLETQQQEIEELKKSVSFLMKEIERLGGNNE